MFLRTTLLTMLVVSGSMLAAYELKVTSSAGPDGIVKCGEKVSMTIQALKDGKEITDEDLYLEASSYVDGVGREGVRIPASKIYTFTTTLDKPGRAYIRGRIKSKKDPQKVFLLKNPLNNKQNSLKMHGIGVFADPEKRRIMRAEPADFDQFWDEQKKLLEKEPMKVLEKKAFAKRSEKNKNFEIWDMKISSPGPAPVSGILTIPRDKSRKYPAMVKYHGAGVRSSLASASDNMITFNVNAHGLPNGKPKAFYQDILDNRNPYNGTAEERFEMFRNMFLRALRALEYIRTLPEWNGKDLIVRGGSQGGIQTITAAAQDKHVTMAVPTIPAMIGLGEFLDGRKIEAAWPRPYADDFYRGKDVSAIAGKFDYLDGAFQLRRVKCPIYITVGLYDFHAAHVYAALNECPAEVKNITCVPNMGHFGYNPVGDKAIAEVVQKNLKSLP